MTDEMKPMSGGGSRERGAEERGAARGESGRRAAGASASAYHDGNHVSGSRPAEGETRDGNARRAYGSRAVEASASAHRDGNRASGSRHADGESRDVSARRAYGSRAVGASASAHRDGNRINSSHPADGDKTRDGSARRAYGSRAAEADASAHRDGNRINSSRHAEGESRDGSARRAYGSRAVEAGASAHRDEYRTNSSHPADGESRDGSARRAYGSRAVEAGASAHRDGNRRNSSRPTDGESRKGSAFHESSVRREHASPRRNPTAPASLDARRLALDVLTDVHRDGAYASLALDKRLRAATLRPEDRRLATSLIYGTLENELRLDYALDSLMEHPTHEAVQRDILRMGAYQILFLDRVPDSAAVNEAVKLTRALGMESSAGFINAVLRNLSRGKDEIAWPKREDDLKQYLSVMGSMPMWLTERLIADYGEEEAERVILYREQEHPVVVRPNMTRLSDEAFEQLLSQKEWRAERGLAPHAWLVYGAADIAGDADFRRGLFSIQGQSSMLAAEAIQAKPGMKVLDACAAPGGKSAYLCEQMQLTGRVFAWELHEKRAALLDSMRRRLKLDNLRVSVRDALDPRPDLYDALDAVLLDAPCAGLGVLAQKPDVKLRLKPEDIPAIVDTQKRLLDTVSRYVRSGGTLVYSTCSLLPEENALQVRAFLEAHPNFVMEPLPISFPEELRRRQTPDGLQLLGCRDGVEGFFIAKMRRVR